MLDESMDALEEIKDISNELYDKVASFASIMQPKEIRLLKGTKEEFEGLVADMLASNELIRLNPELYPNCYLYRSDKNDVARTEQNTYICTKNKDDVGPTNNWADEDEMLNKLMALLSGIMKGKTMYVLPYLLGPAGSRFARCGVELTDSKYVAISQMIIAKVGQEAIECIRNGDFVFGVQATGTLDPSNKYIAHFPSKKLIITVNSAYGGNALLSKKCHALRIEGYLSKEKERLIEHMMAIEVIDPQGRHFGITGAFPSGSGKTNLAMLSPPDDYKSWQVRLLSDDIAWFEVSQGMLVATNPEYGFFGIVPGTDEHSNPNALKAIRKNTIFTNVALDLENNTPWWEGLAPMPKELVDWQGNRQFAGPATHPNARFTTPIEQYPFLSQAYGSKEGLPIHAILFGGRRSTTMPLVYEAYDYEQGILIGAMLRAETTAAVAGKVGIIRNDPMAMIPFCSYNMADYFDHFHSVVSKLEKKPKFFNVNWFRKDASGKFMWPGFGENMRVISWITKRVTGEAEAIESPIGYLPEKSSFDKGKISEETLDLLLKVDKKEWLEELDAVEGFFNQFGERMPKWLWNAFYKLRDRLRSW